MAAHGLAEVESGSPAPAWKMVVFGLLTFWAPYVFVWFVLKPVYPRWFRVVLVSWTVFWIGCLVFYIAAAFFGPAGRPM